MKNVWKWTATMLLASTVLFGYGPSSTLVSAEEILPISGQVKGNLSGFETDEYFVTLDEAGKLSFDMTAYGPTTEFILTDEYSSTLMDRSLDSDGKTPARKFDYYYLEAGRYRLTVNNDNSTSSNYKIETTFKAALGQDIEPNNGTSEAQVLLFNQKVRGLLSEQDDRDVYSIVVPKDGTVTFDIATYISWESKILLKDQNGKEINSEDLSSSEKTPGRWVQSFDLAAGTYYLYMDRSYSGYTGVYDIQASFKAANNTEHEPNDGIIEAENLAFYKKVTGFLHWSDQNDFYKIIVPKKSQITLELSSYLTSMRINWIDQQGKTIDSESLSGEPKTPGRYLNTWSFPKGTYYLQINDADYYTGRYQFQVKSSHLLPSISLKAMNVKSTHVSGTTEKGATVTLKLGKKTYTKKAEAKGHFDWKVQKQKAGTVITVTSQNKYGKTTKQLRVSKK
ncbi:Ig-like domain-containing protein [Exiguobacterium indicum]|uniref:Ig-like domain-containing protein n=1 Tax=Exiguobacterium indicum TaxID=296995 RepID=UPI00397E1261